MLYHVIAYSKKLQEFLQAWRCSSFEIKITPDTTSGDEDAAIHESLSQCSQQHWFSLKNSLCKVSLEARAVCDALN